jgi:ATP-dependent DNA ligase
MVLQRADKLFASPDWVYEPKWDGFRMLASVRLISRNGVSFTNLFGPVSDALRGFPTSIVLDGEVIAIKDQGQPDFEAQALVQRLQSLGYAATSSDKSDAYRVWVGGYFDREMAERLAASLRKAGFVVVLVP